MRIAWPNYVYFYIFLSRLNKVILTPRKRWNTCHDFSFLVSNTEHEQQRAELSLCSVVHLFFTCSIPGEQGWSGTKVINEENFRSQKEEVTVREQVMWWKLCLCFLRKYDKCVQFTEILETSHGAYSLNFLSLLLLYFAINKEKINRERKDTTTHRAKIFVFSYLESNTRFLLLS